MALKDVKSRIASVKNIQKITRAMEMVAAARLRRAEQRIEALRPYAGAIRRMTRQAAEAAGNVPNLPILNEHESEDKIGILLITGDRGLAGSFNSQIIREGVRLKAQLAADGAKPIYSAVGRRGVSSMKFRGEDITGEYTGFTDRPAFADARSIADDLIAAYVDEDVDRVDIIFNRYESPLTQYVTRQTLLPIQEAAVFGEGSEDESDEAREGQDEDLVEAHRKALWVYEPEPEELLAELVPEYAQLSVYRALLESTASEHGSRMTAMRNAAENAKEVISDLTLEMNRVRQAEITQEILEVVGGAEGLS